MDEQLRLLAAAPPPAAAEPGGEGLRLPKGGRARRCAELAAAAQFLDDRLAMTGSESARLAEQALSPLPLRVNREAS